MLFPEWIKRVVFYVLPCHSTETCAHKACSLDAHGGLCADRACGYLIARCTQGRYATHSERWVRKSAIVVTRSIVCTHERLCAQQMHTTSETQRCLLKCNVQQWDGALVVTRFRVYACALEQTRCSENTKGSGEP